MLFFTDVPATAASPNAPPIPLSSSGVCRDERGRVRVRCLPPGVVVKFDRPTSSPTAAAQAPAHDRHGSTRAPR